MLRELYQKNVRKLTTSITEKTADEFMDQLLMVIKDIEIKLNMKTN